MKGDLFLLILTGCCLMGCDKKQALFQNIPSSHSGVHFNNSITEYDSLNPMDNALMYNGGGVAIGDFNNDGHQDIYFTGNQVACALYINKGGLRFEEVTQVSGVSGEGQWCNGAAVVDINQDGWLDIYVSTSMKTPAVERSNLLYINAGVNEEGIPRFTEQAEAYRLADTGYNVQAAFFDFDNDHDLDVYLARTQPTNSFTSQLKPIISDGTAENTDKLFRNDWNDSLNHPVFTDISSRAGIVWEGYALGLAVADLNNDGWKDIYVTNDFNSVDECYVNNGDGTFTNKINNYFRHTSLNAMGNDIADLNNDGLPDIIALDMVPEDNYRKKMNMKANSYSGFLLMKRFGYNLQYVRNTLQLNRGCVTLDGDSLPDPVFSEIGFYAGIAETDWSWSALLADYDNDGYKDLSVTNGYAKDVTDHDFITFYYQQINGARPAPSKTGLTAKMSQSKIANYIFKGNPDLKFENKTRDWGFNMPSFSNGAAYADLDNDGDLDFVVNNINDKAFILENTLDSGSHNHLRVKFKGSEGNKNGLGATVKLYYNGHVQFFENSPYRGYLSSCENMAHFGLGSAPIIDSVQIVWPGFLSQTLYNVETNQTILADIKDARPLKSRSHTSAPLFSDITHRSNLNADHRQPDYYDFEKQRLLSLKLSQFGPCLAAGDVNGDGLDDLFVGGSALQKGKILFQQSDGRFVEKKFEPGNGTVKDPEMTGSLLFDADQDHDLDLVITSGYFEKPNDTLIYRDALYQNDGKGNFSPVHNALPDNNASNFCVKAADYDRDGKLDLFIGQRFISRKYPLPSSGFILRNETGNGQVKFSDVTDDIAGELKNIGMISDALWTDFDNDGWIDLVLVGEWMPPTFLKNEKGRFRNITPDTGLQHETGWWNSIASGDFNNDGLTDYVAGNLGLNSYYKTSPQHPVKLYVKDFDSNGSIDPVCTRFSIDQMHTDGEIVQLKEFPARGRDELIAQLPMLKKNFLSYKAYAHADINTLFTQEQLEGATVLKANNFKSSVMLNKGNGKFNILPLPDEAQFSSIFGMITEDLDDDGSLDMLINGNNYGAEPSLGPYDALNGLVLRGDGTGNFSTVSMQKSGVYIPGDGRALVKLRRADNSMVIIASENSGSSKAYKLNGSLTSWFTFQQDDAYVILYYKDGSKRKEELYYGSSFLSQSTRSVWYNKDVLKADIVNYRGIKRSVSLVRAKPIK